MSAADTLPSASALGLVRLIHLPTVDSTMDVAHCFAEQGAPAGTLVLADCQTRGRGRSGKAWESAIGAGLLMTLLERPKDRATSGVLALRIGMALAEALAPFVDGRIRLKWPNDLFVQGKLAGILVEARWRDAMIDWVAVGIGVNIRLPDGDLHASCVRDGVSRSMLLMAIVPAMRAAAQCSGPLTPLERDRWAARDLAVGRRVLAPVAGVVRGIGADGALIVERADGEQASILSGTMIFADPTEDSGGVSTTS